MFSINKFTPQSIKSMQGRLNNSNVTEFAKNKIYINLLFKKLPFTFVQG